MDDKSDGIPGFSSLSRDARERSKDPNIKKTRGQRLRTFSNIAVEGRAMDIH